MNGRDDHLPSFDPRTWAATGAAPGAERAKTESSPADDGGSFDPRAWVDPAPEAPRPVAEAPPGEAPRGPVSTAVAIGSGAAILLAGAALLWWQRPAAQPENKAPAPVAAAPRATEAPPAAAPSGSSRRTLVIADARQLGATLASLGLPETTVHAIAPQLAAIGAAPGEVRLSYEVAPDGALTAIEVTRNDGSGVSLTAASAGGFTAERLAADVKTTVRAVLGEMDETNFYSSAVTAGIDDSLITEFAKALSFDFNFQTEIAAGDVFGAAIEQATNAAGRPVGLPRLVYVSMRTGSKSRALYSFAAPGDAAPSWFDANGRSASRALMRTPVDGARISSKFGPRFHPVLHYMKVHRGIDFAAPTGTPIYASGSGTIEFAAFKGANGNLTVLRHDNGWRTLYLHQSRFEAGVGPGARVSQGQKIGEVGTTGRSTGPHLHYEVHIDGEAVDPQSIDTGSGVALEGAALARFKAERERIDRARAAAR